MDMEDVEVKAPLNGNPDNNNIYQFKSKHFPNRPALNIGFNDIKYTVTTWKKLRPQRKEILHGVSGEFRSGEVTAIMGPSGAGKSTLLNILAGFTIRGSEGDIYINGQKRSEIGIEEFKKVSCYIQQDDVVRPLLTVHEAMALATHLKLGCSISQKDKVEKIAELLEMLGMTHQTNTRCGRLSGGQKKRLSMALELITNPPIIFLDEPTTGLDSSSTTSCVSLIKNLARQGRTMVCTVHQPSALIFEQFSQLYCVAAGQCIYQGEPRSVTQFLAHHGLICPPYHNPADFIIEVAAGEYISNLDDLAESADRAAKQRRISLPEKIPKEERGLKLYKMQRNAKGDSSDTEIRPGIKSCLPEPASMWIQAFHLYNRNLMVLRRDLLQIFLRTLAHFFISLVFGVLYAGVGNNAETLFANLVFVYGTNLFLHYTAQMTVLLSFPLEYKVLTREHFNRWYSLAPYYIALLLVEIPFQLSCAMIYLIPGYLLTEQPFEWLRFGSFVMFNLAISLTAQGTGFLTGALLPITIAVFIAPVFSVFLSVFGFTSRYSDITVPMRPFYNISYFRSAFQGSFYSLYGYNRSDLPCYQYYCHYKNPKQIMVDFEFSEFNVPLNVSYILLIGMAAYLATAASVWYKLSRR